MPLLQRILLWSISNWKAFGVGAIILAVGRALMWFSKYRLAEAQRRKFKQDQEQAQLDRAKLEQAKFNHHIGSLAGHVLMWMDMEKKRLGAISVLISENSVKALLEDDADKLPLVMNYLEDKGKAKRDSSGSWILK